MSKRTIDVQGQRISLLNIEQEDYISITDIAKKFNPRTGQLILNWMRSRSTISFLGTWEKLYNENFNVLEFEDIKSRTGDNTFVLSVTDWVEKTNATGIKSTRGRYGGTYAHLDIALEFLSYLSPEFKLYVIKEFQRLKEMEQRETLLNHSWDISRLMTKANFHILTDTIREKLIPPNIKEIRRGSTAFSGEVDLINLALFGMTAAEWRKENPELDGNIRDHASIEQLIVLSNLQSLDAKLIEWECDEAQRLGILNEAARKEMEILLRKVDIKAIDTLKDKDIRHLRLK